jgi:hypothetical protein
MTTKRLLTAVFIAALAVGFLWGGLARGQGPSFLIEGADQTHYESLTQSSVLSSLLDALGPHFVVDNADSLRHAPLLFPWGLHGSLDGLPAHFVLDMADSNRFNSLAYPQTLIGDATPPRETTPPAIIPAGNGSVKIRWATNEFSRGTVDFGLQSGQYTRSVAEPLHAKAHEVTLTGLFAGATYYYRITNTDPTGNHAATTERSFTVGASSMSVFLPMTVDR